MQFALRRHDEIIRSAIVAQKGVVFKTVGDAFCAAFWTAPDAVGAMVEAQQSLAAERWPDSMEIKVRMALHTGVVDFRDGDYFGRTLNRLARLLAIGHGGQCLISESTQVLLKGDSANFNVRPMGLHRLKDLENPETVFQVDWNSDAQDFPPLRSLDSDEFPNNLPVQTTSFVGREQELEQVLNLMERTHLLTLTGAGGCGKSRLALQTAAELTARFSDGIWFVEIAPLQDGDLVAQTIAGVLKLSVGQGQNVLDVLCTNLKSKETLLVLDNCEHVIADCARIADALLRSCKSLRILCTSREPLTISGEVTYRVPSLSVPSQPFLATEENLGQYASVQLFIDRALAIDPSFAVTNDNAPSLADICFRLDGIPLAIELAAARIRSFSLEEIRARLNDSFKLLTGGSRTALPRQQTLRSLIDWSYDLLSEPEKILFARLSCFSGSWSMEAAEAICGDRAVADIGVVDLLSALVDKSLVVALPRPTGTRFRFLETIRQYASECLERGSERDDMIRRHIEYFIEFVCDGRTKLEGPDCSIWRVRYDDDIDNIRSAFHHCLADPKGGENACKIAGDFGTYFYHRGLITEGIDVMQRAITHSADTPHIKPRLSAHNVGGWLAHTANNTELAESFWTDLMGLAVGHEPEMVAAARNGLGLVCSQHRQEYSLALEHFEETLRVAHTVGRTPSIPLMNMGDTLMRMGEYDRAEEKLEEGMRVCIQHELTESLLTTRFALGLVQMHRGNFEEAHQLFDQVIADARHGGFLVRLYDALVANADALLAMGGAQQALEVLDDANAVWEAQDVGGYDLECQAVRVRTLASLGRVEEAKATFAYAHRSLPNMHQPMSQYLFFDAAAHLALATGKHTLTAELQGAAQAISDSWAEYLHVDLKLRFDALADKLKDTLGQPAYQDSLAAGATTSPAEIASRLLDAKQTADTMLDPSSV